MNIYEKLVDIQCKLVAPKNKYSSFGNYHYRSCEDIMSAAKPLCLEHKTVLTVTDTLFNIGDDKYIKSIAVIRDCEKPDDFIECVGYAQIDVKKAKMDLSQMTGSASTYARKYALNGLLGIDDNKDADDLTDIQHKANTPGNQEKSALVGLDEITNINNELVRTGVSKETVLKMAKVKTMQEMTIQTYNAVMAKFKNTKTKG